MSHAAGSLFDFSATFLKTALCVRRRQTERIQTPAWVSPHDKTQLNIQIKCSNSNMMKTCSKTRRLCHVRYIIDLLDDDDDVEEEDDQGGVRISDSPIRSFTPISEATDCLIDFRKQQRSRKLSRRRR